MHHDARSYLFGTDISRTGKAILHVLDELKAWGASKMLHWKQKQGGFSA